MSKFIKSYLICALGLGAVSLPGAAMAQATPSPGDIQRLVEPERPSALPKLQTEPPRLTQPSRPAPGADTSVIRRWDIQGNTLLSTDALTETLQPFTGVPLSVTQIREAALVLQQAYEDAGWLARVTVPPQDITEGTVRLQVSEAVLGRILVDPQSTSRVDLEKVKAVVAAQQPLGQKLNTNRLSRGLLLADDLDGVSVVGSLQPGQTEGGTDVLLRTTANPPLSLDLMADNSNSRSVGSARLVAALKWLSPAGWGESYNAQALKSEGSDYLRLGASVPLGDGAWKLAGHASKMNYKIITPDADGRKQDIKGQVSTLGLDLNYPLLRARQANLVFRAGAERRNYRGQVNGDLSTSYHIDGVQLALDGNVFDNLWGGGATAYSLGWHQGNVRAGSVEVNESVAGRYSKWAWSLSRQQALSRSLTLFAALNGQTTGNKELDSAENFSLGGSNAVRAYPSSEGSGPQGYVGTMELRWRVTPEWLLTPFVDAGRVSKRSESVGGPAAYSLKGAGLAVQWTGPSGVTAKLTYARRMGNNPNADANGMDGDGTLRRNRFWISVSSNF